MLSKMANPQTPLANANKEPLANPQEPLANPQEPLANAKTKYNYSYKEIANKDLSKCKVVELKAFAKTLDIRVSGNKDELRTRITTHIKQSASAIKVQSWIRRKLVYMWIGLKGNTKDCVNIAGAWVSTGLATATLGGDNTSVLQGELTVTFINQ